MKLFIQNLITGSRWLLVPFYIGLIIAQVFYCFKFICEVAHLCSTFWTVSESEMMLLILTLIDITMVAALIKMIIMGSYHSFVERIEDSSAEKTTSGLLKVKMGAALVGVSSIHLLQSFINWQATSTKELFVKCSIHLIFLISTLGLAYIDYLHSISIKHD